MLIHRTMFFQVIAFLRQPNILEILRERQGQHMVSRPLREKINILRVEGVPALERLGHDLQLTILLRCVTHVLLIYLFSKSKRLIN